MRVRAIATFRCPHCQKGRVFSGIFAMREFCPHCGIRYEREQGYFMMSIFFGYVLGFILLVPICLALYLIDAPVYWYLVSSAIVLLAASPLLFRYSRVLWLHLDELLDPRADP